MRMPTSGKMMTPTSQAALAQPLRSSLRKMSVMIQNISMSHRTQPKKYSTDRNMSSIGYPVIAHTPLVNARQPSTRGRDGQVEHPPGSAPQAHPSRVKPRAAKRREVLGHQ